MAEYFCRIDDLLITYVDSPRTLSPPFRLTLNEQALPKPYLGIPLESTRQFFLVAAAPPKLPRRPALALLDVTGTTVSFPAKAAAFSLADWKKNVSRNQTLFFLNYIWKHLETLLGPRPDSFWNDLASRFADVTEAQGTALADGRIYLQAAFPGATEAASIGLVRLGFPPRRQPGLEALALLERGNLHLVVPRDAVPAEETGQQHLIITAGDSALLPVSVQIIRARGAASDPYRDILDLAGPSAALGEYLKKAAGIRPALSAAEQSLAAHLKGRLTELQGTALIGWALDESRPDQHITIGLSIDGDALATTVADLPVNAPEETGWAGNHGFRLALPDHCLDGQEHCLRLSLPERPDYATSQAFPIGRGHFDGEIRIEGGSRLQGWLRERCREREPVTLSLQLDGDAVDSRNIAPGAGSDRDAFEFDLPHWIQDGDRHSASVWVHRDGLEPVLLAKPVEYRAHYRGAIMRVDPTLVAGWIVNDSAPDQMVTLDLYINGVRDFTGETKKVQDRNGTTVFAFSFFLEVLQPGESYRSIALYLAGTRHRVLGPERIVTPVDSIIESLTRGAGLIRAGDADPRAHEWVRRQVLQPLIGELRKAAAIPPSVTLNFTPVVQCETPRPLDRILDIVVPVHSGTDQTLACLDSLEAHRSDQQPYEVVVINDRSPEPALTEQLRQRAAAGRITLLENPSNLGFVGASNRGLQLHRDRDVVLLNSDTVVPPRWAERLRRVAYANAAIGTVTPFSNNGSICSLPRGNADNPLPPGWTPEQLDGVLHQANGDGYHDLPTGVGFCMYIKRQLLDEVGYLDEEEWGRGYAEENDLCLRAATLGWRNVSADGIFVFHHGAISFGATRPPQLAANLAKLYRLYPDYQGTVQRFLAADPLAAARSPLNRELLRRHAARYLLFVSHDLGGGTQVAIDDLGAGLAAEGLAVLELRSQRNGKWLLQAHGTDYGVNYRPDQFDTLVADLRELGTWHIHYHQIPFFPRRILELPALLGIAYDVTAHDYLAICPRINMQDETGWYCGESQLDTATCNRCIAALGPTEDVEPLYAEYGDDVGAWRSQHRQFFAGARRVFIPSRATAAILGQHLPLDNAAVQPHPDPAFPLQRCTVADDGTVRVAVIGAIGNHKGYDLLLACARTAYKDGLPLRFVVAGYTQDDAAFDRLANVLITGPYRRADLPELLARHQCRLAAFLSPWPETYCYTLSEAWRCGLYPVAFDLGAPAERIRQAGYGDVIPITSDPKRINRALLEAGERARQAPPRSTAGNSYRSIAADYYGFASASGKPTRRRRNA